MARTMQSYNVTTLTRNLVISDLFKKGYSRKKLGQMFCLKTRRIQYILEQLDRYRKRVAREDAKAKAAL